MSFFSNVSVIALFVIASLEANAWDAPLNDLLAGNNVISTTSINTMNDGKLTLQSNYFCPANGAIYYSGGYTDIYPMELVDGEWIVRRDYNWNKKYFKVDESVQFEVPISITQGAPLYKTVYSMLYQPAVNIDTQTCMYACDSGLCSASATKVTLINTDLPKSNPGIVALEVVGNGVQKNADGSYQVSPDSVFDIKYKIGGNIRLVDLAPGGELVYLYVNDNLTNSNAWVVPEYWEQGFLNDRYFTLGASDYVVGGVTELRVKTSINIDRHFEEVNYDDDVKEIVIHIGEVSKPEISVKSVKLAQVVYNPQITPYTKPEYEKADAYTPLSNNFGTTGFIAVQDKSVE